MKVSHNSHLFKFHISIYYNIFHVDKILDYYYWSNKRVIHEPTMSMINSKSLFD